MWLGGSEKERSLNHSFLITESRESERGLMVTQVVGGRMGGRDMAEDLIYCASPVFPVSRRRAFGIDPDDEGTGDNEVLKLKIL